MVKKTYTVVAHGIRIEAVDIENKEAAKKKIQEDNGRLYLGLDVVKAKWIASAGRLARGGGKKRYSSLIIDVAIEDIASGLVLRGIVKAGEAKEVSYYVYGVAQYFNYQE